jgi:XTP/dITP diphosphohydrolase
MSIITKFPAKLLIASQNKGKVIEFRELFNSLQVEIIGLSEFNISESPEETGSSYSENACLKATHYSRLTGHWTLADDSGLEVEALDGKPGINSARFGGAGASDGERITRLLSLLSNSNQRSARFVCSLALSDPSGRIVLESFGSVEGVIAESPRGSNGFGYDPIFIPNGFEKTFAELTPDEKQKISHRKAASVKMIEKMRDFFGSSLDQSYFGL